MVLCVRLPVGSEQKYGQHDKTRCERRTKGTEDGLGKGETRVLPTETAGEKGSLVITTPHLYFLTEHGKTKYSERKLAATLLTLWPWKWTFKSSTSFM